MDPTIRLRIATRIHFALLRHFDENVAVGTLLKGEGDAREALWVCEASGREELVTLARQFEAATRAERQAPAPAASAPRSTVAPTNPAARGATPQDMAWTHDTSGFGVTRPPEAGEQHLSKASAWLIPSRWLRPASAR